MRLSSKVWATIFALQQAGPSDFEAAFESLCESLDLLFAHYQSLINAVLSDLQIRNMLFVHHIVAFMDESCSKGVIRLSNHSIYLITELGQAKTSSSSSKRKTQTKKNTANPVFDEVFRVMIF